MIRQICTVVATAVAVVGGASVASASPGGVASVEQGAQPLFTCVSQVVSPEANVAPDIDWLKVHTRPGTTTPAVGQLKSGAQFCITSNSHPYANGHYWTYGYGYNGSKLTGWVAGDDLIYP